jgi:uncharacterized cupredoxin-like copper-binding protein
MRKIFGAVVSVGILASAVPVLADPGHGHGTQSLGRPANPQMAKRTIEVTMDDEMRFTPAKIQVKRGETVKFIVKNKGEMKHEMMLGSKKELIEHAKLMQQYPDMEHDDPNAVTVEPGKTGQLVWQFTQAGDFMFGCLMPGHYEAGMVGSLVVERSVASRSQSVVPATAK